MRPITLKTRRIHSDVLRSGTGERTVTFHDPNNTADSGVVSMWRSGGRLLVDVHDLEGNVAVRVPEGSQQERDIAERYFARRFPVAIPNAETLFLFSDGYERFMDVISIPVYVAPQEGEEDYRRAQSEARWVQIATVRIKGAGEPIADITQEGAAYLMRYDMRTIINTALDHYDRHKR